MGAFSQSMRAVAISLIGQYGSDCILTKVTPGQYDPVAGETVEARTDYPMKYAQSSRFNDEFDRSGANTNLSGFNEEAVVIAWFGQIVDATWEFNGQNIIGVRETKTQNDIVIYALSIGEKV